jgi:hypothetical protein
VADVTALAQVIRHPARRAGVEDPKEIVAVILADGSVKDLRSETSESKAGLMSSGTLSGPDWVLWWERRSF